MFGRCHAFLVFLAYDVIGAVEPPKITRFLAHGFRVVSGEASKSVACVAQGTHCSLALARYARIARIALFCYVRGLGCGGW